MTPRPARATAATPEPAPADAGRPAAAAHRRPGAGGRGRRGPGPRRGRAHAAGAVGAGARRRARRRGAHRHPAAPASSVRRRGATARHRSPGAARGPGTTGPAQPPPADLLILAAAGAVIGATLGLFGSLLRDDDDPRRTPGDRAHRAQRPASRSRRCPASRPRPARRSRTSRTPTWPSTSSTSQRRPHAEPEVERPHRRRGPVRALRDLARPNLLRQFPAGTTEAESPTRSPGRPGLLRARRGDPERRSASRSRSRGA